MTVDVHTKRKDTDFALPVKKRISLCDGVKYKRYFVFKVVTRAVPDGSKPSPIYQKMSSYAHFLNPGCTFSNTVSNQNGLKTTSINTSYTESI